MVSHVKCTSLDFISMTGKGKHSETHSAVFYVAKTVRPPAHRQNKTFCPSASSEGRHFVVLSDRDAGKCLFSLPQHKSLQANYYEGCPDEIRSSSRCCASEREQRPVRSVTGSQAARPGLDYRYGRDFYPLYPLGDPFIGNNAAGVAR